MISFKHICACFNEHIFRWVEYGAIDHTIIDKLQNEEESRVRLHGGGGAQQVRLYASLGQIPGVYLVYYYLDLLGFLC